MRGGRVAFRAVDERRRAVYGGSWTGEWTRRTKVERKEQRDGQTNGRVTQIGSAQPILRRETRQLRSSRPSCTGSRTVCSIIPRCTRAPPSSIIKIRKFRLEQLFTYVESDIHFDGWPGPFMRREQEESGVNSLETNRRIRIVTILLNKYFSLTRSRYKGKHGWRVRIYIYIY